MKLNLGTPSAGGGASEGGKNGRIVYEESGIRVMQFKSSAYWKFFVYRTDVFPKLEKDPERFGKEFFNQQEAQRHFNEIKTTKNVIKLP